MKLTNKQIQNIVGGTNRLSEEIKAGHLRLEYGTTLAVAILKKKLAPLAEAFAETRDALVEEYCMRDAAGQKKKIPATEFLPEQWDLGENKVKYEQDIKGLFLTVIEVDRLEPLPLASFKIKKVKGADGKEEDGDIDPDILFLLTPWLVIEA